MKDFKFADEEQRDKWLFAGGAAVFWGINALATFAFGFQFCWPLVYGLIPAAWIGWSEAVVYGISGVIAGLITLAALDAGYLFWFRVYARGCDGPGQRWAAAAMAGVAFVSSLAYTALAIAVLLGQDYLNGQTLTTLTWLGSIWLAVILCLHIATMGAYKVLDPAFIEQQAEIVHQTRLRAETLRFRRSVYDEALAEVVQGAEAYRGDVKTQINAQLLPLLVDAARPTPTVEPVSQNESGPAFGLPQKMEATGGEGVTLAEDEPGKD